MRSEFHDLRVRVNNTFKAVIIGIIWLTIVALVCVAVPAFGAEPYSGEVQMSSVSCFTDFHFFDGWATSTTATWDVKTNQYEHNRFEMEVRTKTGPGCVWGGVCPNDWVTALRVPYGAEGADLSDLDIEDGVRFFLVDRFTGEEREWEPSPHAVAMCSFMAPPEGSAWVWWNGGFSLRMVDSWEVIR